MTGSKRSRGARALRAAGCGLFLFLCLLAADGACYLRWRAAAERRPPRRPFLKSVRHVPPETLRRLGWIDTESESSFVRFEEARRPGVIRIGCLGDSFTYGAEAGPGEDYPSLLQKLFRERGYPQVEVLNFSSGWYGFQQVYILYDEVARRFSLDYVVLGPMAFFPGRDTTFNHASAVTPYFHHARRVLDGQGLRLLEVIGDDFARRAAAYLSFVPHWRYLRYDSRPPAFLACLLPRGRELRNPFYYQPDPEAEALTLYERLLTAMADGGSRIVLGHYLPAIVSVGERVRRDNFYATRLSQPEGFPYQAARSHNGPAGNLLLAEQYFALLTGKSGVRLPLMKFEPLAPGPAPKGPVPARGLDAYERISVGLDGGRPWRFVEVMQGNRVREVPGDYFRARGLDALILFRLPDRDLPQALFYPLAADLEEGMPLTVRPQRGPRAGTEVLLGKVSLLRPGLNVGVVDLNEVFGSERSGFDDEAAAAPARGPFRKAFPGDVYLGGRRILLASRPKGSDRVALRPPVGRFLQIYPPAALLGEGGRGIGGTLSLSLEPGSGRRLRVPLGRCRRVPGGFQDDFAPAEGLQPIRRPK